MKDSWINKCLKCQHCYFRKDDADTMYCRCRNGKCKFKEKSNTENKNLAKEGKKDANS